MKFIIFCQIKESTKRKKVVSERNSVLFYMQHQCNSVEMYTDDYRADVVVALQPSSIDRYRQFSLPYIIVLYIIP